MAFLDFLNQPTGGFQQAQGPNMVGEAGVGAPQAIGPTYGDLLKVGMQTGSKPGSSAPLIAGQVNTQPLQPLQMQPTPQEKQAAQGDDSLGQIVSLLLGIIGL